MDRDGGSREVEIKDCMGQVIQRLELQLSPGIHLLPIPPAGIATLIIGGLPKENHDAATN
ncbi:hypothetical protein [Paenibacillus sp. N3.4]|uniref:hypothetical protein n=1 Tax=Paenibacillus sp. N3.4 TaxID=2603222 RepID=UPI0011CBA883|nr:hypothetical protein [Paenibacillus sp. N3.4]TXK85042.1 hypothetical protein FU659_05970 [Paenibacillus sp. N3.4]